MELEDRTPQENAELKQLFRMLLETCGRYPSPDAVRGYAWAVRDLKLQPVKDAIDWHIRNVSSANGRHICPTAGDIRAKAFDLRDSSDPRIEERQYVGPGDREWAKAMLPKVLEAIERPGSALGVAKLLGPEYVERVRTAQARRESRYAEFLKTPQSAQNR